MATSPTTTRLHVMLTTPIVEAACLAPLSLILNELTEKTLTFPVRRSRPGVKQTGPAQRAIDGANHNIIPRQVQQACLLGPWWVTPHRVPRD